MKVHEGGVPNRRPEVWLGTGERHACMSTRSIHSIGDDTQEKRLVVSVEIK